MGIKSGVGDNRILNIGKAAVCGFLMLPFNKKTVPVGTPYHLRS